MEKHEQHSKSLDPVAAASSRSRYGAPHAAAHPSFVNRIYTDGSYIAGLESVNAQHVKKTKGPPNLLCLNLVDLHRCIFVCGPEFLVSAKKLKCGVKNEIFFLRWVWMTGHWIYSCF